MGPSVRVKHGLAAFAFGARERAAAATLVCPRVQAEPCPCQPPAYLPYWHQMRRLLLDPVFAVEPETQVRLCDHPGCVAGGEFRAPKSRLELRDYYWFCLDHIRAYNSAWNYYAGMSDREIEAEIRRDTVWQRPSWRLGDRHGPGYAERIRDYFGMLSGSAGGSSDRRRGNGDRAPVSYTHLTLPTILLV